MSAPGKQGNYRIALEQGFETLRIRPIEDLQSLGATNVGEGRFELPVLDAHFVVDLNKGRVELANSSRDASLRIQWQIVAVHYLAARRAEPESAAWICFADLPDARAYDPVYRARVLGRLCATAGQSREDFLEACRNLGAEPVEMGDLGFRFQIFPRLAVKIAWYAGDEDFPPGASFLYPDNILIYLSVEDTVVTSENLVGRLQGMGFEDQ